MKEYRIHLRVIDWGYTGVYYAGGLSWVWAIFFTSLYPFPITDVYLFLFLLLGSWVVVVWLVSKLTYKVAFATLSDDELHVRVPGFLFFRRRKEYNVSFREIASYNDKYDSSWKFGNKSSRRESFSIVVTMGNGEKYNFDPSTSVFSMTTINFRQDFMAFFKDYLKRNDIKTHTEYNKITARNHFTKIVVD